MLRVVPSGGGPGNGRAAGLGAHLVGVNHLHIPSQPADLSHVDRDLDDPPSRRGVPLVSGCWFGDDDRLLAPRGVNAGISGPSLR